MFPDVLVSRRIEVDAEDFRPEARRFIVGINVHGAVCFPTSLILELWRYRDFRDKSSVNGLFGSNLSVDASEVRCASHPMDPILE